MTQKKETEKKPVKAPVKKKVQTKSASKAPAKTITKTPAPTTAKQRADAKANDKAKAISKLDESLRVRPKQWSPNNRKSNVGRPTDYNEELALLFCEGIAEGYSTRNICQAEGMPSPSTIYNWLIKYPEFMEQYARAREIQADVLSDETLELADNVPPIKDFVSKAKLQVDQRNYTAARLNPKKYGAKIDLSSSDGSMSPNSALEAMSDAQLAKIVADHEAQIGEAMDE